MKQLKKYLFLCLILFDLPALGSAENPDQNFVGILNTLNYPDSVTIDGGTWFSADGINVENSLFVGSQYNSGDPIRSLYINTPGKTFSLKSRNKKDITVKGKLDLQLGYNFTLGGENSANRSNLTIGAINNLGNLKLVNIDILSMNKIDSTINGTIFNKRGASFSADVNSAILKSIDNKGDFNLESSGKVDLVSFSNEGKVNIKGSEVKFSENINNKGDFTWNTSKVIASSSSSAGIVNSGDMTFKGSNVEIDSKIDHKSGLLKFENLANLTLKKSLLSQSNIEGKVLGDSTFEDNFNLENMGENKIFKWETGTINFTKEKAPSFYNLVNKLRSFSLKVNNGGVVFGKIVNESGKTEIIAKTIMVEGDVENRSKDGNELLLTSTGGDTLIKGDLTLHYRNKILSSGDIILGKYDGSGNYISGGNIKNNGETILSGKNITINNILGLSSYNNPDHPSLTIRADNNSGKVSINNLTNDRGFTQVEGHNIDIKGDIESRAYKDSDIQQLRTLIKGNLLSNSSKIKIGSVIVKNGRVDIEGNKDLDISKNVFVEKGKGVLNIGGAISNINIKGNLKANSLTANSSQLGVNDALGRLNLTTNGLVSLKAKTIELGDIKLNEEIGKNISLESTDLNASIKVKNDVMVKNNTLTFTGTDKTKLVVGGRLYLDDGAIVNLKKIISAELDHLKMHINSLLKTEKTKSIITKNGIDIGGNLTFDTSAVKGLVIGRDSFELNSGSFIQIAGNLNVSSGKKLVINAKGDISVFKNSNIDGISEITSDEGSINLKKGINYLVVGNNGSLKAKSKNFIANKIQNNNRINIESDGGVNIDEYVSGGVNSRFKSKSKIFVASIIENSNEMDIVSDKLSKFGTYKGKSNSNLNLLSDKFVIDNLFEIMQGKAKIEADSIVNSGNFEINGNVYQGKDDTFDSGSKLVLMKKKDKGVDYTNALDIKANEFNITGNLIAKTDFNNRYRNKANYTFNKATLKDINVESGSGVNMKSNSIDMQDIENYGDLKISGENSKFENITNDNDADLNINYTNIKTNNIDNSGNLNFAGEEGIFNQIINRENGKFNFDVKKITVKDELENSGQMNLKGKNAKFLKKITNNKNLSLDFEDVEGDNILNSGNLTISGENSKFKDVVNNKLLNLYSKITKLKSLTVSDNSDTILTGNKLDIEENLVLKGSISNNSNKAKGGLKIDSDDLELSASSIKTESIEDLIGKLKIKTNNLEVSGDINSDVSIYSLRDNNFLNLTVGGSIFDGAKLYNIVSMKIENDYHFGSNSILNVFIKKKSESPKYWSKVETNPLNFGSITNYHTNPEPLVSIGGKLIGGINAPGSGTNNILNNGQFGAHFTEIVDSGTAIWLLKAGKGIENIGKLNLANAIVKFCNADGTHCFNYLDSSQVADAEKNKRMYLTLRDTDGDGKPDSVYLVFDPRFGGPLQLLKIQPLVAPVEDLRVGEYKTAGAIDNLIASKLTQDKFYNKTPVQVLKTLFTGSEFEPLSNEIYERLKQYSVDRNGKPLARLSGLLQPRETELIQGMIALNNHLDSRDFEERMFDEFLWNRNRNLNKIWGEAKYGFIKQDLKDGDLTSVGNRFALSGGIDFKLGDTTIFGLTGRVSRSSNGYIDDIDLRYAGNTKGIKEGKVKTDVVDTNVSGGLYLLQILDQDVRLYINGLIGLDLIDVEREQNYFSKIKGNGSSLSVSSEWGLMHNIAYQYVVGNFFLRGGYNFGLSVNERFKSGNTYSDIEGDGYLMLTPGYSLMFDKRIYTSYWFQVKPHLSLGVEYDILGQPKTTDFKFANAVDYTQYDTFIDKFWANGIAGIELLSANGWQAGIDYRYYYNHSIQAHNIRLSGSYRF